MALTCRDIPELPGLGAIHLRGGSSGGDITVRWPYLAENRSFSNWVRGGELVFVTGISRHRSPANLVEALIARIGSHQLQRLIRQYLPRVEAELLASRDLLEVWLRERGNQCAMAEALGCHRNTIRNRMNRLVAEMPPEAEPNEYFKTLVLAHLLSRP